MNRWHIRREANFEPYPWFVYRDNSEDLDQNSELACIEGGSHPTWEMAYEALEYALRLDMYIITEEESAWQQ
jgi:hypothetical protein